MHKIVFDSKSHTYTLDKKVLISVSQLISKYKNPFDPSGSIIQKCSEKRGISVEELRAEWDETRDSAAIRGINFHKQAEYWVKNKKILDEDYKDVVEQLSKYKFKGKLQAESIIFSADLELAGTVDLIDRYEGNKADIFDYKTNKALKRNGFWDREKRGYQMMLPPISHLQDCNFIHYSLQQFLYSIICEENGMWVQEKNLFYINPKTRIMELHPVALVRNEAFAILKHYNSLSDL